MEWLLAVKAKITSGNATDKGDGLNDTPNEKSKSIADIPI
jgi:hypothetical protein